jgi:hypothetical protein
MISMNVNAIHLLRENIDKVNWTMLALNQSGIPLLLENNHMIEWPILSSNPEAIHFLLENPDKINWDYFSKNSHPLAIELLRQNTNRINWHFFSLNSGIFYPSYNYTKIKYTIGDIIYAELIQYLYNLNRIARFIRKYYDNDYELYWYEWCEWSNFLQN